MLQEQLVKTDRSQKQIQNQRDLLVKQVRRWGDLNADAVLDANCTLFSTPGIDGVIGYRVEGKCAIVFGEPLCSKADRPRLAKAFQDYCNEHQYNIVYTIISEQFALANQAGHICIQFGHKIVLDPSDSPVNKTGPKAVLVRKKVKHAKHAGVDVKEYLSRDPAIENEIQEMGVAWQKKRRGPQIYIAHLNFFNDRIGKRWIYAEHEGKIVAFLILNETQDSEGWLLNNLITTAQAPSGTSELLILSTLEILNNEGCKNVVIGPVTDKNIQRIIGTGEITSWLIKGLFKVAKMCFRLDGQAVFWDKFQAGIRPSYVMFDKLNMRTVRALLTGMNVGI